MHYKHGLGCFFLCALLACTEELPQEEVVSSSSSGETLAEQLRKQTAVLPAEDMLAIGTDIETLVDTQTLEPDTTDSEVSTIMCSIETC